VKGNLKPWEVLADLGKTHFTEGNAKLFIYSYPPKGPETEDSEKGPETKAEKKKPY